MPAVRGAQGQHTPFAVGKKLRGIPEWVLARPAKVVAESANMFWIADQFAEGRSLNCAGA